MLDQESAVRCFAHRANDFIVIRVANQHDGVALALEANGLQMHFRHEWTGGVDDVQIALNRFCAHRWRHAMSGENDPRLTGHLCQFIHKNRPRRAQLVHNVFVMYDFLADVDWRTIQVQRNFDNINRADHACAKATWRKKNDFLIRRRTR